MDQDKQIRTVFDLEEFNTDILKKVAFRVAASFGTMADTDDAVQILSEELLKINIDAFSQMPETNTDIIAVAVSKAKYRALGVVASPAWCHSWRNNKKHIPLAFVEWLDWPVATDMDGATAVIDIARAWKTLALDDRVFLRLVFWEGHSVRSLARVYQIGLTTVQQWMKRILQQLREATDGMDRDADTLHDRAVG